MDSHRKGAGVDRRDLTGETPLRLSQTTMLDARSDMMYGRSIRASEAKGGSDMRMDRGRGDMPVQRWLGAGGGIAFGLLTLAGWAAWARPSLFSSIRTAPDVGASSAHIARYYVEHATSARIGALLGTIALLPLLSFVVALYQRLRAAEGDEAPLSLLALLAGVMVCVEHFLFCGFLYQAAFAPSTVGPQVTAAWHYAYAAGGAASITYIALLGAVAIVSLRYGGLPRRIGVLAAVAAPLQLLYLPASFGRLGTFDPLSGVLGVYVPFTAFLLWCIAAGVAMARPTAPLDARLDTATPDAKPPGHDLSAAT